MDEIDRKTIREPLNDDPVTEYLKENGRKGGKKRWEGKTEEEIKEHMSMMGKSRKK